MCYYVDELATVWESVTRKARKEHRCECCRMPILKGVTYDRHSSLYDGHWSHASMHSDCHELTRHIQLHVCDQDAYLLGEEPLRDEVLEHLDDAPDLADDWEEILQARIAEGVPESLVDAQRLASELP